MQNAPNPGQGPLPRVLVLATGGTIAGAAARPELTTRYTAGQVAVGAMLAAVSGLDAVARVDAEQLAQINSKNIGEAHWDAIGARVAAAMVAPDLAGVVITHGTDTLEETALFLQLTLACPRPVVLCGAMRPATALSADGPLNLLQAIRVAADPAAAGRGVLVAMQQQVFAAVEVTKVAAHALDAFAAPIAGPLARIEDEAIRWLRPPQAPPPPLTLAPAAPWPWVEIVHSHGAAGPRALRALLAAGVQGLVVAGTGSGGIHEAMLPAIEEARRAGVPVVRATRCLLGPVIRGSGNDDEATGLAVAARLNAQKARLALALALRAGWRDPLAIDAWLAGL